MRVFELDHAAWNCAPPVSIARYWSGDEAPPERHAEARVIWDEEAVSVRFVCRQSEPLVVSAAPRLDEKAMGLWERDVCEMFIATPEACDAGSYFEFEAAPTGEWLDLAISILREGRETVWDFQSGMTTAARISPDTITVAMRVPFAPFGRTPRAGERWRANFFRCVGAGTERGYLAWQPTHTEEPSFHVPQKFGWLVFKR